jgi:putative SOS response-associated peptidase YedK
MCGKFTQYASWQDVHAFSQPLVVRKPHELVVSTPMRPAHIMRLDANGQRVMVPMRWGFSGVSDRTPSVPRHIHARSETVDRLRTFAQAFHAARGILMVATFNEGEEVGKRTKQWTITPNDGLPIAIAVICEQWTNGTDVFDTFVMVTTPPNALIARITDRMPAILPRETWATWLGRPGVAPTDAKAVLQTFEDGGNWTMEPQLSSKPSRPPKPPSAQGSLL